MERLTFNDDGRKLLRATNVRFKDLFDGWYKSRLEACTDPIKRERLRAKLEFWKSEFKFACKGRGIEYSRFKALVEAINAMQLNRERGGGVIELDVDKHARDGDPIERKDKKNVPTEQSPLNSATLLNESISEVVSAAAAPGPQPNGGITWLLTTYLYRLLLHFDRLELPGLSDDSPSLAKLKALFVDLPLEMTRKAERPQSIVEGWQVSPPENSKQGEKSVQPDVPLTIVFSQLAESRRSAVILGEGGSGKSTLLAARILHLASAEAERLRGHESQPQADEPKTVTRQNVPIALRCSDLIGADASTFRKVLLRQLEQFGFVASEQRQLADHLLLLHRQGDATIIVDGLDHLPTEDARWQLSRHLAEHAREPESCVLVTARPASFTVVSSVFRELDLLKVGAFGKDEQLAYVAKWSEFSPGANSALLHVRILDNQNLARLRENAFMFALLVRFCPNTPDISLRRVDVIHRVVQELIERRQVVPRHKTLRFNEVHAHLEYLALKMRDRSEPVDDLPENEIWQLFREFRSMDRDEPYSAANNPAKLLDAIVERVGLLNVVRRERKFGCDHRRIQFFHPLFRDYFVGQAIINARDGAVGSLKERICAMLGLSDDRHPVLQTRAMKALGDGRRAEPVVGDKWRDAISLAIASLDNADAEEITRSILPPPDATSDAFRARAVLALQLLADEPLISVKCAKDVVGVGTNAVRDEDSSSNNQNTLLDIAITEVSSSSFGTLLRDHLLRRLIKCRGQQQWRIAKLTRSAFRPESTLDNDSIRRYLADIEGGEKQARLKGAFCLCNVFYGEGVRHTHLERVPSPDVRTDAVRKLLRLSLACKSQALRLVMLWTTNSAIGACTDLPYRMLLWDAEQEGILLTLMEQVHDDDVTLGLLAEMLPYGNVAKQRSSVLEWIIHWVLVSNGGRPLSKQTIPKGGRRTTLVRILKRHLIRATAPRARLGLALALGRIGGCAHEMIEPLMSHFENDLLTEVERDEPLTHLVNCRVPAIAERLATAARTDAYTFPGKFAILGLVGYGDASLLRQMLLSCPAILRSSYAFGLAALADPEGKKILQELCKHEDKAIRTVASKALAKAKTWQT